MTDVERPAGLGVAGGRLWDAIVGDFVLQEHERVLLESCARVADTIDALVAEVGDGPLTVDGSHGVKIKPQVVELRQQRITLARMLASLRVPFGAEDVGEDGHGPPRLQRRSGVRGVHGITGGAA